MAVLLVPLNAVVPAGASTTVLKPYSLVICAFGTDETCAPNPTSNANQPAGVPADQSGFPATAAVPMTAAFLNENKVGTGINLGSANLTAPAGFTVSGASFGGATLAPCTPSTPSTTSCLNGNTIELRNIDVIPGAMMTLAMTVAPPTTLAACTVASPCAWAVLSKQSNDFSSQPGNDLNVDPATSTLSTVLAQLQFGTQPHKVLVTEPPPATPHFITSNDYAPGTPVTVQAVDGAAAPNLVLSYSGPVTVALNPATLGGSGAVLGGTLTVNAMNGVASFSNLTVNVAGSGYSLTANAPDLPPPTTSTTFDVQQAASICDANHCPPIDAASSDFGSAGGIDGTASAGAGTAGAELTETVDFGNQQQYHQTIERGACNSYSSAHDEWVGLTQKQRLITGSITTSVLFNVTGSAISGQNDCFAASTPTGQPFQILDTTTRPFMLEAATPVTLPDGTSGFAGLLADCGTKNNQVDPTVGPCVQSRTGMSNPSGGGTLTITISSPFDYWNSG
jgi:hypothetical protein